MRGWEPYIDEDLHPLTLIKRGFGGSNYADALHYVDELVLVHEPRAVLVYEGDNDIGGVGVSPEKAFQTARAFINRIHQQLPECRIYLIAAKPSPSRWQKWPVMQELNQRLANYCAIDERLFFLDVGPIMMDDSGVVDKTIFKEDMLHMNRAGYERWRSVIRPVLIRNEQQFEKPRKIGLNKVWELGDGLSTPESVYYHASDDVLFVSNIAGGAPADADGDGFIAKLSPTGRIIQLKWATGLDAPKGMAVHGDYLYVANINELVRINLVDGRISARYPAEGAVFLNDVATDARGNVFVGDSSEDNSCIYRLERGQLEVWLESSEISRPNGLSIENGALLAGNVGNNNLNRIDVVSRHITHLADTGSRIDGLEPLGDGYYLVSNWLGRIALIEPGGRVSVVQDTSEDNVNAADFEYLADQHLLVVPTFFDNRVIAYRLTF